MTGHDLGGAVLFAVAVIGAARMGWWLFRAMNAYEPHCVYRIPLVDGRPYYGHAKDKDVRLRRHYQYQKTLPEGHPRKWWALVPPHVRDGRPLVMPDEWIVGWYRSKAVAEQMEQQKIRDAEARGIVTANRIKYKGVTDHEAA